SDLRRVERVVASAARADDEFPDSPGRVGRAVRGLGGEPLVVVLVACENHVRSRVVQVLPKRRQSRIAAVHHTGAETGVVPYRERTRSGVGGEVGIEPCQLGRGVEHSTEHHLLLEARIQHHDVPGSQIITVVPDGSVTRGDTEVTEVPVGSRVYDRRSGGQMLLIVVIAGRGVGALLEATPRRLVAARIIDVPPVRIRVVAEREHGAIWNGVDQSGRLLRPTPGALTDVPGADEI